MQKIQKEKGFTLIELLIVIALIAIIAAVVFVALDPLTRFQDARDSRRASDASNLLTAIKVDQVDNGGKYLWSIDAISPASSSDVFMISNATTTTGCANYNDYCLTDVTGDSACINLQDLSDEGYLAELPISPDGDGTWSGAITGYTLQKQGRNVTIRACEAENTDEIVLRR